MDTKFIDAVQTENLVRTRLALSNELMLDPRGLTFKEMLQYAESNLSLLYQEDDGKIYDNDPTKWNEDFLYDIKNSLDLNFSREKLTIYETVAKHVLKEKAEQMEQNDINELSRHSSEKEKKSSNTGTTQINKKAIYIGLTIGGTVIAVAGLCIHKTALASLGVAGVIVGSVLLYNEMKK